MFANGAEKSGMRAKIRILPVGTEIRALFCQKEQIFIEKLTKPTERYCNFQKTCYNEYIK